MLKYKIEQYSSQVRKAGGENKLFGYIRVNKLPSKIQNVAFKVERIAKKNKVLKKEIRTRCWYGVYHLIHDLKRMNCWNDEYKAILFTWMYGDKNE